MMRRSSAAALAALLVIVGLAGDAAADNTADSRHFEFGAAKPSARYINVRPDMEYSAARGFGFESGASVRTVEDASGDHLHAGYLTGDKPFFFSVDLPEGNYNVTVTLGDGKAASSTTVKAELRRLMLENVATAPGASVTRTFTVNVRTPRIPASGTLAAGGVKLKVPRETVQEAWAWDQRLTLESMAPIRPCARSTSPGAGADPVPAGRLHRLRPARRAIQQLGPNAAALLQTRHRRRQPWRVRRNLPRLAGNGAASTRSSARCVPATPVFMQFGHNDQKQIKDGKGGPFTTYKAEIKCPRRGVRARGGVPCIVSSMERRGFDARARSFRR
jgi:hypothetical protein